MSNLSNKTIWEYVKDGKEIDSLLKDVPDEFFKKIKSYIGDLKYAHYSIYNHCGKHHDYFRYGKYNDVYPEPTKKEFAEFVFKNNDKKLHSVMFLIWDGKDPDQAIWKLLKPEYERL